MAGSDADPFDLERFVRAQSGSYEGAIRELRGGLKTGHWIWFIFPQLVALGRSGMAQRYGISGLDEARAYAAHPVLGPRLVACCAALLRREDRSAVAILGELDALKVRSCATLFLRAAPDEPVFGRVLDAFYAGVPDPRTEALLR